MKITGNTPQHVRPDAAKPATGSTPAAPAAQPAPKPAAPRTDSVQISNAGRALAGTVEKTSGEGLTPERTAEIRQRILTGAYNSTAIVEQVARRILDQGDA
jgi:anti-sigma28 factor (negative regulator of flagellin synthesis)